MIRNADCEPVVLVAEIPEQARAWRNDIRIRRWCRQDGLISHAHHFEWLGKISHDQSIIMMGIEKLVADTTRRAPAPITGHTPIGVCGLTSINRKNSNAEFSLYIAPEHQRKGYATKALRLLLEFGFKDLGLNRIWGEVFDGNPAMKIFKELGFKEEGRQRQTYWKEGRFIDTDIVSILREDYL
jgi:RimJ/RimL family protein N-acetyltransferase